MSEDATCHCDDPRDPARKLWLCGTELCKALTSKAYRNGYQSWKDVKRTIVIGEQKD